MPRHTTYVPHGVVPAVLLPFDNDLAIDEAGFRKHLRDVAATEGLSAITINAHSTEVASCTFDEQKRVLDIARPYLGEVVGVRGDWTPLDGREHLFAEDLDREDPWQFKNIRVV